MKVTRFVAEADAFAVLNALFAEFFPVAPPVRSTPLAQLPRGLLFSMQSPSFPHACVAEREPEPDHNPLHGVCSARIVTAATS